jgi:hypothetical protein
MSIVQQRLVGWRAFKPPAKLDKQTQDGRDQPSDEPAERPEKNVEATERKDTERPT